MSSAPHSCAGDRFPAEIISYAVWLYYRFSFSLRHVAELLAARRITLSHVTVLQWSLKFGQVFASQITLSNDALMIMAAQPSEKKRRGWAVNSFTRTITSKLAHEIGA